MTEAHTAYLAWHEGQKPTGSGTPFAGTLFDGPGSSEESVSGPALDAGVEDVATDAAECGTAGHGLSAASEAERLQLRDRMITEELPQVHFIALRLLERLPASVQLEDLVHAGVIGLMEAFDSFDHTRNAQFRTFARFRVRGAMLDSLRDLDWASRSVRRRAREISETVQKLEAELGRQPEREEVAHALGMSLTQLEQARSDIDQLQIVGQFQSVAGDTDEVTDLIEGAPGNWDSPFDAYAQAEQKQQLVAAIRKLNEREQLVLSLYYREELTMKEVATVIGVAVSRVSQIHQAAMQKLRRLLAVHESSDDRGAQATARTGHGVTGSRAAAERRARA